MADQSPAPSTGDQQPAAVPAEPKPKDQQQAAVPEVKEKPPEKSAVERAKEALLAPVAPVTPETYDLKFPDGETPDPGEVAKFVEFAKTHGYSQKQAQAAVDFQATQAKRQNEALAAKLEAEVAAFVAAPESKETLDLARQAWLKFGDDEVAKVLGVAIVTPVVQKWLAKIGKAVAEDQAVGTGQGVGVPPPRGAAVMYPSMKK